MQLTQILPFNASPIHVHLSVQLPSRLSPGIATGFNTFIQTIGATTSTECGCPLSPMMRHSLLSQLHAYQIVRYPHKSTQRSAQTCSRPRCILSLEPSENPPSSCSFFERRASKPVKYAHSEAQAAVEVVAALEAVLVDEGKAEQAEKLR